MITYKVTTGQTVEVRIDGSLTGRIKKARGGFRYYVVGGRHMGPVFPTIAEVKADLEAE